jgi:hypothetical protein
MNTRVWNCGGLGLLILVFASSVFAQSRTHMLKGDFAFTYTSGCLNSQAVYFPQYVAPAGFGTNFAALGPTGVYTQSFQGVRTFNGDGTGSMTARIVTVGTILTANDHSGQFTYSVLADGTLTIDEGPFHVVYVAGVRIGQQLRVTDLPISVGRLSSDGNSFTFASFFPAVETVTRTVPAPEVLDALRICHRAGNAIRISRRPGANGHED